MIRANRKPFIALFCGVMLMPTQTSCILHSRLVKISGTVIIGGEWTQLRPGSPLKAEKDSQLVVLDLDPPFKYDLDKEGSGPDRGHGVLTPEGETVNPEIELIDEYGATFRLVYTGATGILTAAESPVYGTAYGTPKLPQDRKYTEVRIRSPKPIKCKAIYWFCESTKDWK
jgi:hypothetical protein